MLGNQERMTGYFKMNNAYQNKPDTIMDMLHKKVHSPLIVLAILFSLFISSACTPMPEGNAGNGERWFRMNRCNGCHGEKGSGGIGPNGAKGPVIAGLELNYGRFLRQLRNPNSAIMPSFSENQLSDKDAADIFLWLKDQKKS